MKKFAKEFFLRGLVAASGGPIILAIVYGCMDRTGAVTSLSPGEVSMAIISITLLALTAGGMTAIYQMEQLPLASAILIHGGSLYAAYILTYLINGWLQKQLIPILVFTAIFIVGYALIWLIIWAVSRKKIRDINEKLSARN